MKTRLLLLILCSLSLLPVQTGCVENNRKQANITPSAEAEKTLRQAGKSADQMTEELFYGLVQELSAGKESSGTLVCTEYPNTAQAFSFIITLISPDAARKSFDRKSEYESDLLELGYSEVKADGGFARLSLKFKKRKGEPSYTVIFVPGSK